MAEPDHKHSTDVTRNPGRKGDNPAAERGVWRPGHAPGTGPGRPATASLTALVLGGIVTLWSTSGGMAARGRA
jgi:hypothetical protein